MPHIKVLFLKKWSFGKTFLKRIITFKKKNNLKKAKIKVISKKYQSKIKFNK